MEKQAINPPDLFDGPSAGISQAIVAGDTIYCSGQVAFGASLEEQAEGAFANAQVLLAAAGASLDDVVKMTVYTTEEDCWPRTAAVRAKYLHPPYPAATMVVIRQLANAALMIEVDLIAVRTPKA